ncbi:MAG: enolase C-terminal domain-like protein [Acidimicrobiales bacterium]
MLSVEVWRAPTPIPRPVLTVVGIYDTYFHLVVVVRDGDLHGWGMSGMATLAHLDAAVECATRLVDGRPDLAQLLGIEHAGHDTASRGATNAISLAAWDFAARRLGVACADLWGRRPETTTLPCYGSGFFLDATIEQLREEARAYRQAGYRLVKMRTGLSVDEDLARFDAVREIFPDPGTVAVDSVNSWQPADARAFVERASARLLWLEDATPYAQLGELKGIGAPLAAGESLETIPDLDELRDLGGMQYALLDVQRLGGPVLWLRAASALAAKGARIGSHVYTPHSVHLMACIDDPLPVEVFDWSDPLFVVPPAADANGELTVVGPGFGMDLDFDFLRAHGERVFTA